MAQARPGSGSGTKLFYVILGVIVIGGVAALVYAARGGSGAATEPVEMSGLEDPQALFAAATPVKRGPDDAPVKVVEFGDYECPGCGYFALSIRPVVDDRFVESGAVQFIYYDFPLTEIHRHAFLAARAGRCAAEQDRFWEYHDLLYATREQWAPSSNALREFVDLAGQLGLDASAFEACLRSDRYADVVTANRLLGEQLGVNSTPTVIVNGRRVPVESMTGRNPSQPLVEAIQAALPSR